MTAKESTDGSGKTAYTYECPDCGHRTKASTRPGACANCGGDVRNIGVASEQ